MVIRLARPEDTEDIVSLHRLLADYHRRIDDYYKEGKDTADNFRLFLQDMFARKDARVIVAEDRGKLAGYFIGIIRASKPYVRHARTGRISDAFIRENYRHQGLGNMMFEHLKNWFKEHGIQHIELSVDVRNAAGIKAWRKYGFRDFMLKMRLDMEEE